MSRFAKEYKLSGSPSITLMVYETASGFSWQVAIKPTHNGASLIYGRADYENRGLAFEDALWWVDHYNTHVL